jgi:hypothetical protein
MSLIPVHGSCRSSSLLSTVDLHVHVLAHHARRLKGLHIRLLGEVGRTRQCIGFSPFYCSCEMLPVIGPLCDRHRVKYTHVEATVLCIFLSCVSILSSSSPGLVCKGGHAPCETNEERRGRQARAKLILCL